ncbi:MAG: hypothetical protein VST68_08055 [Nitrospirota bacterium]|nr:hypothetical protein [Nitrospirota bacterium]
MKRLLVAGAALALIVVSQTGSWAGELTPEQQQEVRKIIQETLGGGPGTPPPGSGTPIFGDTSEQKVSYGSNFSGGSTLQGGRTIYAKPFVRAPKTIVGGYIDFTITDCNGGSRDCSRGLEFDQERFVPFFYSQVTDRLSVASEVEIEHGGPQSNQSDGDIKIEFATMDYRIADWLNLRGGILLLPMGRFNLVHDSPLNDLPLRPMVSRLIIPSTFAESGFGIYGTFYPTQLSKVDYELYVTQGFDGDDTGGSPATKVFSEANGLRSIRGSMSKDNNENKAIVSRVSVSPILGVEVAGSVHHGYWDDNSNNALTLWAIDGNLQRGPFELQGEAAWANIEGGSTMPSTTIATFAPPANMSGYYVQFNYHFFPEVLKQMAPSHFSDSSTFTAVVRWGQVDTNTASATNVNEIDRLTLGLNLRPTEDSVLKFSYTFNDHNAGTVGPAHSPGSANGWQATATTYF